MLADAREELLDVAPLGEVQDRVERRDDQGKSASETDPSHVAVHCANPLSDLARLACEAPLEAVEHRLGEIDARHVDSGAAQLPGNPARPDAVLQDGATRDTAEPQVVRYVVAAGG